MKIPAFLFLSVVSTAPAASLTLGEALVRVESGHPWFRTRTATAALAAARTDLAAAKPPPEISLEVENALGTGELRAARSVETTLQFSRALDWAGRRAARVETASALGQAARLAWEEQRRALLGEAARRFIRVAAAQAELAASRQHADLVKQTLDDLRLRAGRAAAATADVARARLALAEAGLAAEHAEHLLLSARQSLASLWGAETPDFDEAEADFASLPVADTYESLAPRLSDSATQARYAALARWRLAQEKLVRTAGARGDPRWAAGLRRAEATDDFALVFGLNYAWPASRATGAQAAEARAEHDRTAAEGAAALLDARALLFELCQELNHARIEHDAARDEMIPAAQSWLQSIESAPAGRYGARELLEARTTLFAARRRQTEAAAEYHLTLVAIEQTLGAPAQP